MAATAQPMLLRTIVPTVSAQTCLVCQRRTTNLFKFGQNSADSNSGIAADLKKYLNVEATSGAVCEQCQKTVTKIGAKVDELRGSVVERDAQFSKLKNVLRETSAGVGQQTWVDQETTMRHDLYEMQKYGVFCDVTIVDEVGARVPAHACMLSAGSPALRDMLLRHNRILSKFNSDKAILNLKGICQADWALIMEYLYLGQISLNVKATALIERIYLVAKKLQILGLVDLIQSKVLALQLPEKDPSPQDSSSFNKTTPVAPAGKSIIVKAEPVIAEETDAQTLFSSILEDSALDTRAGTSQENLLSQAKDRVTGTATAAETRDRKDKSLVSVHEKKDRYGRENVEFIAHVLGLGDWNYAPCSCRLCGAVFEKKMLLIDHIADDCKKLTRSKFISDQEKLQMQLKAQKLAQLNEKMARLKEKQEIQAEQLLNMPKKEYVCFNDTCKAKFDNKPMYIKHLEECVLDKSQSQTVRTFKCENHKVFCENFPDVNPDGTVKFQAYKDVDTVTGKWKYHCSLCTVKMDSLCKITGHINMVHYNVTPYVCKVCSMGFGYLSAFKDHYEAQHTSVIYRCTEPTCHQMFASIQKMQVHVKSVHKKEKEAFLCPVCGKTFPRKSSLQIHQVTHNREDSPFECPTCGKKFGSKFVLRQHMVIHDNAAPLYRCSQCTFSSKRKGNLILHEKRHTQGGRIAGFRKKGPKKGFRHPNRCHLCGKTFRLKERLEHHLECHAKARSYDCPTCWRRFMSKMSLNKHLEAGCTATSTEVGNEMKMEALNEPRFFQQTEVLSRVDKVETVVVSSALDLQDLLPIERQSSLTVHTETCSASNNLKLSELSTTLSQFDSMNKLGSAFPEATIQEYNPEEVIVPEGFVLHVVNSN